MKKIVLFLTKFKKIHVFTIFRSITKVLQDASSFIYTKVVHTETSGGYLYTQIKKRAHHLEKFLFYPDSVVNAELAYKDLTKYLAKWEELLYSKNSVIHWALKVKSEYENKEGKKHACIRFEKQLLNEKSPDISTDDLMSLIKQRRSGRFFKERALSKKEKDVLSEAAIWAPSSCNRQTVNLIFVEDSELKNEVSKNIPGGKAFFNNAPCILVLIADKRDYRFPEERMTPYQDSSAAIQNILLAGETLGLACCWGSFTSYGSVINENKIRSLLNIPDHFLITGSIAIGEKIFDPCVVPRDLPSERYFLNTFKEKTFNKTD